MGLIDWLNRTFPPKDPDPHRDLKRNDPCYCGSGKKYKNCHLPKDEAKRSTARA